MGLSDQIEERVIQMKNTSDFNLKNKTGLT